ncbi:hypothetical protein FRIGORI9N_180012 [Frigoribacterium sp. 9N]|nr:hypothetical protein FRIGORI9N_180012 [Frigoribacterium sp. 9N]
MRDATGSRPLRQQHHGQAAQGCRDRTHHDTPHAVASPHRRGPEPLLRGPRDRTPGDPLRHRHGGRRRQRESRRRPLPQQRALPVNDDLVYVELVPTEPLDLSMLFAAEAA